MRLAVALCLVIAWRAIAHAAPADFEVQASNVTAHPIGQKLNSGAKLVLPKGGTVTLIDRTGATLKTRGCVGKYDGPVENCTSNSSKCPLWKKLLNICPKESSVVPHATRGLG